MTRWNGGKVINVNQSIHMLLIIVKGRRVERWYFKSYEWVLVLYTALYYLEKSCLIRSVGSLISEISKLIYKIDSEVLALVTGRDSYFRSWQEHGFLWSSDSVCSSHLSFLSGCILVMQLSFLCDLMDCVYQAPPSMLEFSRQEY